MRYHYPRRKRGNLEADSNNLRVSLHTDGLVCMPDEQANWLRRFVAFSRHTLLDMASTLPSKGKNL